ncbi:MAG: formate dehydrogenase, partial [Burkholderiaceae bacterium]|nr:formate dehydrogenase [Burkholderiaceae bacterium]
VASQTPLGQAVVQNVAEAVTTKPDGYHLTAHIKKYYQTTLV